MSAEGLAVVTGASAGIGAATARRLSRAGHPVLLLARRPPEPDAWGLAPAMSAAIDVRDHEAARAAIERAVAEFGDVRILVNNAGIMPLGDVATQPLEEWQSTMDVNLVAAMSMTQLVLPRMVARGEGTIVFVTSLAARQVFAHHAAYGASKAAMHAAADAVRLEAAPFGVRVVEVAPGMVTTGLIDGTSSESLRSNYLAEREHTLDPDVVASTIEWICSLPPEVCVRELHLAHSKQV